MGLTGQSLCSEACSSRLHAAEPRSRRTLPGCPLRRFAAWLRSAALESAPEDAPWRRWKPEAQQAAVADLLSPQCAQDARRFKRLLKVCVAPVPPRFYAAFSKRIGRFKRLLQVGTRAGGHTASAGCWARRQRRIVCHGAACLGLRVCNPEPQKRAWWCALSLAPAACPALCAGDGGGQEEGAAGGPACERRLTHPGAHAHIQTWTGNWHPVCASSDLHGSQVIGQVCTPRVKSGASKERRQETVLLKNRGGGWSGRASRSALVHSVATKTGTGDGPIMQAERSNAAPVRARLGAASCLAAAAACAATIADLLAVAHCRPHLAVPGTGGRQPPRAG